MDPDLFLLGLLVIFGLFPALLPSLETTYALGNTIRDFVYHGSDAILTVILDWLYYTYRFLFNTTSHLLERLFYGAQKYHGAWRSTTNLPRRRPQPRRRLRRKKITARALRALAKHLEIREYISCVGGIYNELKDLRPDFVALADGQKSLETRLEDIRIMTVSNSIELKKLSRRGLNLDSSTGGDEESPAFKCSLFSTAPLHSGPQRLSAVYRRPLKGRTRRHDPAIEQVSKEEQDVASQNPSQDDSPAKVLVQQRTVLRFISDIGLTKASTKEAQPEILGQKQENEVQSSETGSLESEPAKEGQPEASVQGLEEEGHCIDESVSGCISLFEGSVGDLFDMPPPPPANDIPSAPVDALFESLLPPARSQLPSALSATPIEHALRLPETGSLVSQIEHPVATTPPQVTGFVFASAHEDRRKQALDFDENDDEAGVNQDSLEASITTVQFKACEKSKKMLAEIAQDPDMFGPIMRQFIKQQSQAQRTRSEAHFIGAEGKLSRHGQGVEAPKRSARMLKNCRRARQATAQEKKSDSDVAARAFAEEEAAKEEHNDQKFDYGLGDSCTNKDAPCRSFEPWDPVINDEVDDYDRYFHEEEAENSTIHSHACNGDDMTQTLRIGDGSIWNGLSQFESHRLPCQTARTNP